MEYLLLLLILLSSAVITVLFVFGFKNYGPWQNEWLFFAILFLLTWSITGFFRIFNEFTLENYWYLIPLVSIIMGTVLAASDQPKLHNNRVRTLKEKEPIDLKPNPQEKKKLTKYNIFFWMLLFTLSVIIAIQFVIP